MFPQCTIPLEPANILYPLPLSCSIMNVLDCISHDCWGIYIQHPNESITSICNMYALYETWNHSMDTTNPYHTEETLRQNYSKDPLLLLEYVACHDTLVIMLHRLSAIKICALKQSDTDWDISVYYRIERKLSNRFTFDLSDIQKMQDKNNNHYQGIIIEHKKTITSLEEQIDQLESEKQKMKLVYDIKEKDYAQKIYLLEEEIRYVDESIQYGSCIIC